MARAYLTLILRAFRKNSTKKKRKHRTKYELKKKISWEALFPTLKEIEKKNTAKKINEGTRKSHAHRNRET